MRGIMTHRARLLCGSFRSGNDVLLFERVSTKMRRKIGEISNDGHERPPGIHARPAFANLAIEMRNDGDKKVRRVFAPMALEQIHKRLVKKANHPLQQAKKISTAEGPAVLQKNVVLLLDADARELAEHVEAIR